MGIQPTCSQTLHPGWCSAETLDQFGMSGCAFCDMGKPRICSYMFNNLRGESPIHLLFLGKLSHFTNQKSAIYLNNLKILRFIDYQITLTYRPLWWACPFIDLPTNQFRSSSFSPAESQILVKSAMSQYGYGEFAEQCWAFVNRCALVSSFSGGHIAQRYHFYGFLQYPLVNVYITMENHNFQWVNPLFLWSFSIAMLNYQEG